MDRERLSQTQLAKRARVSQATVWRALNGRSERRGAARRKLFAYVGITEWTAQRTPRGARDRVVAAFDRIWDRSQAHAIAVAGVIDALAGLRPISKRQVRR
jgi:transcriptional regulator with XRE-family HTH domain